MMGKGPIHSPVAPTASGSLLLPLTHSQVHFVFNTLKISFSRTDPRSANLPLYCLPIRCFWNDLFSSLSTYFSFFRPTPPLCSFFFRQAQNRQFLEAYPSRVKIKCCFSLLPVLRYRAHHHGSCFLPGYISVLLLSYTVNILRAETVFY